LNIPVLYIHFQKRVAIIGANAFGLHYSWRCQVQPSEILPYYYAAAIYQRSACSILIRNGLNGTRFCCVWVAKAKTAIFF